MKKIVACIIFLVSFFSILNADESLEKSKMVGELETIKNIFDFQYAPKAWKKEFFGWDLETEIEKAKNLVLAKDNITVKDFQIIVRNFFRSARDYHVKAIFISTESAFLPLEIKGVNGKYFITYVNKHLLSDLQFPIQAGDEVILFDGRPIDEVVVELQMNEYGTKGPGTDRALTVRMLTNRSGIIGNEVPRGPISMQIRHLSSNQLKTYQLIWSYKPEKITNNLNNILVSNKSKPSNIKHHTSLIKHFNKPWMTPYYQHSEKKLLNQILNLSDEDEDANEETSPFALGSKTSFVPPLGRIWWNNDKECWKAYVFETPNRQLVGYLRLPNFIDLLGLSIDELKEIIQLFEERTDALVIDQVNNPGGNVFYMYSIASLLSDQALQTPKHSMAITHEDVFHAVDSIPTLELIDSNTTAEEVFGSDLYGYPVTYQFAQYWLEFCRFITDQWSEGKKLTDPYHIFGIDHINPNVSTHYTKPILFLINELDFSCADFLPAILQDNKRATIMGAQTSGAGGYVLTNMLKSRFGIAGFRITGSIASRPDNKLIENLGVTPDISYELTEADYQNGFQGYKQAVLEALNLMMQ